MIIYKFLISFILLICLTKSIKTDDYEDDKRHLETVINPNCNDQCNPDKSTKKSDLSIVYVRSSAMKNNKKVGKDMHFILSTYGGSPAFFIVRTRNDSELKINWDELKKNSPNTIEFLKDNEKVKKESIGILISKLFLWLDKKEDGDYNPKNNITEKIIDTNDLYWNGVNILKSNDQETHVEFSLKEKYSNGTIFLRLMVGNKLQRYCDQPSLLFTSRSVHCQLKFVGFTDLFPKDVSIRLGMELQIMTTGQKFKLVPYSYIDDEYSPGIFKSFTYQFGEVVEDSSFLSFKPNAYLNKDRLIAQTIDTKQSEMVEAKNKDAFEQNNAFNGFYRDDENSKLWKMYLTFGSKGQNFYSKTNYTEFNFVLGLDTLPEPKMSLLIQLIIIFFIGLTITVFTFFPISIFLIARKMKKRQQSELLNNQDSIY